MFIRKTLAVAVAAAGLSAGLTAPAVAASGEAVGSDVDTTHFESTTQDSQVTYDALKDYFRSCDASPETCSLHEDRQFSGRNSTLRAEEKFNLINVHLSKGYIRTYVLTLPGVEGAPITKDYTAHWAHQVRASLREATDKGDHNAIDSLLRDLWCGVNGRPTQVIAMPSAPPVGEDPTP